MAQEKTISEQARKNLENLRQWRNEPKTTGGQFITIPAGSFKILLFDMSDMQTETVEFEPGKPVKRAKYGAYDVLENNTYKQYLSAGKNLSYAIDSNLEEGNIVLKIGRTGERFETKYSVVATTLPPNYKNPLM